VSLRYPIETLALPYRCEEPSCGCHSGNTDPARVIPQRVGRAWEVTVMQKGYAVDVFRAHSLNQALIAVHQGFPAARFDPEE
jgi:hypothetical protein